VITPRRPRFLLTPLFRAHLLGVLLGLLLTGVALPSSAQDPDHAELHIDYSAPWGPLISDAFPDGFAINIGSSDGTPRAAKLLVFDAADRPKASQPPLLTVDSPEAPWHLLRASGLQPSRRYRYVVQLAGHADSNGEVSTAPPLGSEQPLTIAVFGDERGSQSGVAPAARAIVSAITAEAPDLVIGTGDMVPAGGQRESWRALLTCHGALLAQVPYFPALGNHELVGDPEGRFFHSLFPRTDHGYYSVRYGQVLLIFLNGNRPSDPEQVRFLDQVLGAAESDPTIRARLVILHQAPLSASWHCGIGRYVADWLQRFEKYHVDAVIAGHDHSYQRLERNGIAYFVSGGGGATLYEQGECEPLDVMALQHYAAAFHYLMIRITPQPANPGEPRGRDLISVVARSPQGPPLDQVTLPLPRTTAATLHPERLAPGTHPPKMHRGMLRYLWRHHHLAVLLGLLALSVVAVGAARLILHLLRLRRNR
jgi:hypothetical protein